MEAHCYRARHILRRFEHMVQHSRILEKAVNTRSWLWQSNVWLMVSVLALTIRCSPSTYRSYAQQLCMVSATLSAGRTTHLQRPGHMPCAPTSEWSNRRERESLVTHTGKLQPVLIWREKPVLLALLSNLGIPLPASYPVFRTKWREISWVIFCSTIF